MDELAENEWTGQIESILERLWEIDRSLHQELEGCTWDDVKAIENKFQISLPGSFVALLGRLGRSRGSLMPGADFSFPEILAYREAAESLLDESDLDTNLDEHDFVFWMEQGYHFFFFKTGKTEDPPVFFYNDDEPSVVQVAPSFTAWLTTCVNEEAGLRATRERSAAEAAKA